MAYIRDLGDRYRVEVKHTYADGQQLRWSRYVNYDPPPANPRARYEPDATAKMVARLAEEDLHADPPRHPRDRYDRATPAPYDPGMTVAEWFQIWHRTRTHLGRDTHSNQGGLISNHIVPTIGTRPIADLTRDDVQEWAWSLADDLMPRSAGTLMRVFKTGIRAAVVDPRVPISADPVVQIRMERPEPTGRDALTVAQVAALARHARYSWPDDEPGDYAPIILAFAFTGMRARELCRRDRHDLTLRHTLEIRGQALPPPASEVPAAGAQPGRPKTGKRGRRRARAEVKTASGARSIILCEGYAAHLSAYLSTHSSDALWVARDGRRLSYGTVRRIVVEAAAAAIEAGEALPAGITPHWLRHTHETWLAEDRVAETAIVAQVGHAAQGMAGVYRHVTEPMRQQVRDAMEDRWRQVQVALSDPGRQTRRTGGQ